MTEPKTAQAIYDAAVTELKTRKYFHSHYVHYDEELSDDQIRKIFDGNGDEVADEIEQYADDNEWEHDYPELLKDLVEDDEEREILEADVDLHHELWWAIRDHDEGPSVFELLLKNTGNMLFRYDLGYDLNDSTSFDDDTLEEAINEMAEVTGLDAVVNRDAFIELIANASYGGRLYAIWYGDTDDAVMAYLNTEWGNDKAPKSVTFKDPHLLILNKWNGSGMEASFTGTMQRPFVKDDLGPDKDGHGYSWTEVSGPYEPAFKCDVTFSTKEV